MPTTMAPPTSAAFPYPWTTAEELGDEIARISAHTEAANYRKLVLIRALDEMDGWGSQGFRSCAEWLSWRIGVTPGTAREQVRVARALGALPELGRRLETGELSYSVARALTRVATPENEAELVEVALKVDRNPQLVARRGLPRRRQGARRMATPPAGRRRRRTRPPSGTPRRPMGYGGAGPSTSLPGTRRCAPTSPSARRLVSRPRGARNAPHRGFRSTFLNSSAAQMERLVSAWRKTDRVAEAEAERERHRSRELSLVQDTRDGSWVVRGRLDPEAGAALRAALEAAEDELFGEDGPPEEESTDAHRPRAARRADALGRVAEAALGEGLGGEARTADRYQVVVHVTAGTLEGSDDVSAETPGERPPAE